MNTQTQREQNIIRSVFRYETKKTTLYSLQTAILYIAIGLLLYGFAGAAYDLLMEYEILLLPANLITTYEMATFAIPLWAQAVILLLIIMFVLLIIHTLKNSALFIAKIRRITMYWFREANRKDSQT